MQQSNGRDLWCSRIFVPRTEKKKLSEKVFVRNKMVHFLPHSEKFGEHYNESRKS